MQKKLFLILILQCSILLFAMDYISSPLVSETCNSSSVNGNILYMVTNWGLMIYNVENKYNPILLNKIRIDNGDGASYISIFDNWLIIGGNCYSSENSSFIYDISNPVCPEIITELPVSIFDCKISAQRLFIINKESMNLEIYNIEEIDSPVFLSEIENVASFEIFGNTLYTIFRANLDLISNLKVYNIQNIENPILINEIFLSSNDDSTFPYLIIEGENLYIDNVGRFYVFNIETPDEPEIMTNITYELHSRVGAKLVKYGSYLYSQGNIIFYISNPSSPEVVGNYAPNWANINDITIQDDYLYVAIWEDGFYIMDLFNPLYPEITIWHENFDNIFGGYVNDGLAYVASWYKGLTILDVTDPSNSSVLGTYPATYYNDIVVDGNIAYVAADEGLISFDVSNPQNPILLDINNLGGGLDRLLLKDNLIFAVNINLGGLSIFNVENPNNICRIASTDLMESSADLCIKDNYLFVADGNIYSQTNPQWNYSGGLRVFDISDPSNPELITTVNPDSTRFFRSIEIKDNYVFMGSNESGIYVFDVTNPQIPTVFSFINVDQDVAIFDMEIKDNYLYTTSGGGKFIFDIEDMNSIECVDFYHGGELNNCWSICVDGNYIYEAGTAAFNIFYTEYAGVQNEEVILPSQGKPFHLYKNYPNPFNPNTMISFEISGKYSALPVSLKIYNIKGQLVKTLIDNQTIESGFHKISWNGRNNDERKVSSGIYLYKLSNENKKNSIKTMLLLK